jgi:hypothetical protein
MKLRLVIISLVPLVLNAKAFATEWQCFQYTDHELVVKDYRRTVVFPLNEKVDDFLVAYKGTSVCVKGIITFNSDGGYFNQLVVTREKGYTYKYQFNAYDIKAAIE